MDTIFLFLLEFHWSVQPDVAVLLPSERDSSLISTAVLSQTTV